jgi:hypothetical protein
MRGAGEIFSYSYSFDFVRHMVIGAYEPGQA